MRYACSTCRKKFRTEGALEMHNQSKHREPIVARAALKKRAQRSAVATVGLSFCGTLLALAFAGGLLWASNTPFARDATPKVIKAVSSVVAWRQE
jgi:hypothetical protein